MPNTPLGIPTPSDTVRISQLARTQRDGFQKVDQLIQERSTPIVTRGTVPDGDNLDDYKGVDYAGVWKLRAAYSYQGLPDWLNPLPAGTTFEVIATPDLDASTQRITVNRFMAWRESQGSETNSWSDWRAVAPLVHEITELAARDGWFALYDPTNELSLNLSAGGGGTTVFGVTDQLGNLPTLTAGETMRPALRRHEFGQMHGIGNGTSASILKASFAPIPLPLTIVTVAQCWDIATEGQAQYLMDGYSSTGLRIRVRGDDRGWGADAGSVPPALVTADEFPHVLCAQFDETGNVTFTVDGELAGYGPAGSNTLNGLTLGGGWGNGTIFKGSIGPLAIYQGTPTAPVLNRMLNLLHNKTGIPKAGLGFGRSGMGTRVYSISGAGKETIIHGDIDAISPDGIQSMTKMMTACVVIDHISSTTALDTTYEVTQDDKDTASNSAARLQVGDLVSIRDLMYLMGLPSDNTAPEMMARIVGQMILDDENTTGDPRQRFYRAMQEKAEELGMERTSFSRAYSRGLVSVRQVAQLMKWITEHPTVWQFFAAASREITITGPNARTYTIEHALLDPAHNPWPFPEFRGGKTGAGHGWEHLVTVWRNQDGTNHITVVADTPGDGKNTRFLELRRAITATNRGAHHYLTASSPQTESAYVGTTVPLEGRAPAATLVEGGAFNIERTESGATLNLLGIKLPEDGTLTDVIPENMRPKALKYGLATVDRTAGVAELRITSDGDISVSGNGTGTLRGSVTWLL